MTDFDKKYTVKDNFLSDVHLTQLDELINNNTYFPWYLQEEQVDGADDGCFLLHKIYSDASTQSDFYVPLIDIFKNYLEYVSLCRIYANLLIKQGLPKASGFHTDFEDTHDKITTAIFYLNTNNGATEFENGDRIDCIRNRLLMFPANLSHRAISQTDVDKRIVLNFNYI